jgi:putative transposase
MAAEGLPVQLACRLLEVAESGFYEWRSRPPSQRAIRHTWLTDQIRAVHAASRGTYGARRVDAELTLCLGVTVGHNQVELLMARVAEGKVYCAVVLDTFSRRVVGWSTDASQTAALVSNALGMAIDNRAPEPGAIVHSDHGVQFTSWAFTDRAKRSGLVPSMGSIGDCYDNAVIESFWGRMQTELLNRQRWNTRIELANAIFEYLEIWHNRRRRHSALGWLTPIEYEKIHNTNHVA